MHSDYYDDPSTKRLGRSCVIVYEEKGTYYHVSVSKGCFNACGSPAGNIYWLSLSFGCESFSCHFTKEDSISMINDKLTGDIEKDFFLRLCLTLIPAEAFLKVCFEAGVKSGKLAKEREIKTALGLCNL